MVKPDNSFPLEVELDATLGEFTNQFIKYFIVVEEQGNQSLHEFIMEVARKVERVQYIKEFLGPILVEHTQIISNATAWIKDPIINTSWVESDYDKCKEFGDKGKGPSL